MASIHISFQGFPDLFPQQHPYLIVCLKLQKKLKYSHLWTQFGHDTDMELGSMIQAPGWHKRKLLLSLTVTRLVVSSPLTLRRSHFVDIWSSLFKLFFNLVHSPSLITRSCSDFIFRSTKPAPPLICLHIPLKNLPHSPLEPSVNYGLDGEITVAYLQFQTTHAHFTSRSFVSWNTA